MAKLQNKQPQDSINQAHVSRALLRIVVQLNEKQYTQDNSIQNRRQVVVFHHNDLSDPVSGEDTSQG